MYGPNTLLTVYVAPKDAYSYNLLRKFHAVSKRRWKVADVMGADEIKVMGNNRRHKGNYLMPVKIAGWKWSRKKNAKAYQDVVGDPYYSYFEQFNGYSLDWWGTGISKDNKENPSKRNKISVPNTPMFNVSIDFDKNSVMEKIYLKNKDYDTARSTTFRGKQGLAEMTSQIRDTLISEGVDKEEANKQAILKADVYMRNLALKNNPQGTNEYKFMVNYYNSHVHETRREMMQFGVNIWFIKEILRHNLNISLYVPTVENELLKIQGLVGKRCKNTIMVMKKPHYVYSFAHDTKIKTFDKGFKALNKLRQMDIKIENPMFGSRSCEVNKRLKSEYMYDFIFDKPTVYPEWVDSFHNVFQSVDYSHMSNLNGKDIIC